jgi:TolB protein
MATTRLMTIAAALAAAVTTLPARPAVPAAAAPQSQQQSEIILSISGESGARPRYAVPDFIGRAADAETQAAARLMGAVLFDDLAFEREFYMVPRDTYRTIPAARSFADIPFDRWRELGADGLVVGSVERTGPAAFRVEVRLFDVRTRRSVMAKEYSGSTSNPRLYAHTAADDIHLQQRALRGAARSKLTFASDRDGLRVANAIADRDVKEVYISDYDGANQKRVTVTRKLNLFPRWSPDARAIAYTSYRSDFPDIYISSIYQGTPPETPTAGRGQNWLPAWSPDGTRLCFTSTRDGNAELYVMNRDGSNLVRLTSNPAIDTSPTWSPSGTQIAFTSDRSGSPQIYIVDADGLNLNKITAESWCDRPTWSPAPFNEIAYASRTGPGYDIRIYDLATQERRQLTSGQGSNESPAYAPNGRHVAFMSTRTGKKQIFVMGRDGLGLKQITTVGNNYMPDWSK